MEEDYILFKLIKDKPIYDCADLSRNMRGKRNGFIYFTESFRIDFEKRVQEYIKMEEELDKKDKVIDLMAKTINDEFSCGEDVEYWKEYFYKKVEEKYDNR